MEWIENAKNAGNQDSRSPEILGGEGPNAEIRVTPKNMAEAFMGSLTPETKRLYMYSLNQFGTWFGTGDNVNSTAARLCSLSAGEANLTMMRYNEHVRKLTRPARAGEAAPLPLSPATRNGRMAGVKSLLKLARTLGLITWALEVPRIKAEKYKDTRGPGREVIQKLIDAESAKTTAPAARNLAIIRLNYDLGLRRGTIVRIDVADWERETASIWVKPKGKLERRRKDLSPQAQAAIERWMKFRGSAPGPMFVRIRSGDTIMVEERLSGDGYFRILRELGDEVGATKKVRPHGIRHTAVTQATRVARSAGLGLEAVMAFSDHANVATLSHYLDVEAGAQKKITQILAAEV